VFFFNLKFPYYPRESVFIRVNPRSIFFRVEGVGFPAMGGSACFYLQTLLE
jgi:hypothetical protein